MPTEEQPLLDAKIPRWKRLLNVEPAVVLYTTAYSLSAANLQNWLLQKDCKHWDEKNMTCISELDAQVHASQEYTFAISGSIFLSVVVTLFAGALQDRNLKYLYWFLITPIAAQALSDGINCLNLLYFDLDSLTTVLYITLIQGFGGWSVTFIAMCSAYVAHTSTVAQRTIKSIYLLFSYTAGVSIASVLGGTAIQYCGFFITYTICILFSIFALIAVIVLVETKNYSYQKETKNKSLRIWHSIIEDFEVLQKKRPDNKRIIIVVLCVASGLAQASSSAEMTVLYLYLRIRFNWDVITFLYYNCLRNFIKCMGSVIGAEVLKRRFQLHDVTLGIFGSVLQTCLAVSWFLVGGNWQIYLCAVIFGSMERVITSAAFSLASKCVDPHEYGRLASIFSTNSLFVPIGIIIYNGIYEKTLSTFPQAIFLFTMFQTVVTFVLFTYLHFLIRKDPLFYLPKPVSEHQ